VDRDQKITGQALTALTEVVAVSRRAMPSMPS
jgi:hypothetical protein